MAGPGRQDQRFQKRLSTAKRRDCRRNKVDSSLHPSLRAYSTCLKMNAISSVVSSHFLTSPLLPIARFMPLTPHENDPHNSQPFSPALLKNSCKFPSTTSSIGSVMSQPTIFVDRS